jgi:AraC family transcriptional regulator, transcriptional activator of pobA
MKTQSIPTLRPSEMQSFHFQTIEWKSRIVLDKHPYFHINRLENIISDLNFPLPPHRKTVHDFIFLKNGYSTRSKGLDDYDFGAGSLFFLPAYQITQHDSMSADVEGFFCQFDERLFSDLPQNYWRELLSFFDLQANPVVVLSSDMQQVVGPIFERILWLYENNTKINIELITNYLLVFLVEIKQDSLQIQKKHKTALVHTAEQYKNALTQYIYQKQTVALYADMLNVSANHLNKCVKKVFDKTAQQLLNEMLILEAKTLLKYSNLQIAEIAIKLCDQSPSNFARFFKQHTGITPKEYIEKD